METILVQSISASRVSDDGKKHFIFEEIEKLLVFEAAYRAIIELPAQSFGGNHSHPRFESFIAVSKGLFLYYVEDNVKKSIEMDPYCLYTVNPHIPHAIVNKSDSSVSLIEYADSEQFDVKRENVYE